MNTPCLIYGSYGYTGRLVVRYAIERGLRPVLAGRNEAALRDQARESGLEYRAFALDDPDAVARGLDGMSVVAHCAGPFSRTARAMAKGCLRAGTHYLDITGEIEVFEALAAMDTRAREAGVMLLPGAGFDVVPSDCLALHLKRQVPAATRLVLAFHSNGRPSHGTATTIVENLHKGLWVREAGALTRKPLGWKQRTIDFGEGPPRGAITIPWGDVSTAYHSTGIPNIEVYMAAPRRARIMIRAARHFGWLLGSRPVNRYLKRRIDDAAPGPTDADRARSYCLLWGEATNDSGGRAEARLRTPDGYTLTALTTLAIAEKVLAGDAPPGFQTPAKAYGPDFILAIDGVTASWNSPQSPSS
ncbi:MAG TPA: saccharopine dehydrogenase NADP-binding domain-containing protein [Candidatus Hydrogenedentes bacterium]|nr:saccharopine dehydrogenase NADP-binding domain-containing protein [Candidatus Hydrogenedentota bacterium]